MKAVKSRINLKKRIGGIIISNMKPITVEIVTNMLTVLGHCQSCQLVFNQAGVEKEVHQETLDDYPKELKEEFQQLSDWIGELVRLYRHRISVRVIDAKSWMGIYKALRHRFRKYPAFIVGKKEVMAGWDREKLSDILDAHIQRDLVRHTSV
jgi:hypothetical protein